MAWKYPPELRDALLSFGLAPRDDTPPYMVRDALSDLYRYELRRMREQLHAGVIPKDGYIDRVIALRKTLLAVDPAAGGVGEDLPVKLALIQQHATADIAGNVDRAVAASRRATADGAELIAFAELAFTPFYPQHPAGARNIRDLAEPVPGPITDRFSALARELGVVFVLNLFERDGAHTFDCSPVIDADGSLLGRTRMVHITEYPTVHERQYYTPSDLGAPIYDTQAGRLGVVICYDRHFPEYMRAFGVPPDGLRPADLVVVPQAGLVDEWPAGLFEGEMQTAAFQNGYFVALCNRVGVEDQVTFSGESFVCAANGEVVARAPRGEDATLIVDVNLRDCDESHARRVMLKDRQPELYRRLLD